METLPKGLHILPVIVCEKIGLIREQQEHCQDLYYGEILQIFGKILPNSEDVSDYDRRARGCHCSKKEYVKNTSEPEGFTV